MLIDKIRKDLLNARRMRNTTITPLLTSLISEASMIGKNAGNRASTDEEVLHMVKKFLKNAEETAALMKTVNRQTTIVDEEIEFLKAYLPKQMLKEEIALAIGELMASNPTAKLGELMKLMKDKYNGLYDAKQASQIIMLQKS